jgi:hypothetical protein
MMDAASRIRLSLLLLRIGVFIVMLMWTLDKFVRPGHAAGVFKKFYGIELGATGFYVLGALELVLIVLFVSGTLKRFSYGAVLLLHGISTLSSHRQYLQPFDNLLFFAAWPMLAACASLYLLRDQDTLWTLEKRPQPG